MAYQGFEDYFERKVIISVAPTGGLHGKEANPNLPTQPAAVAEDVAACEAAGASVVHLHARDEDGEPTTDVERFQAFREAIDDRCEDILVNVTTSGGAPRADRLRPALELDPPPELATIDLGPMNYGTETVRDYCRGQNETFATAMAEHGIKPELEVFNPGQLTELNHLVDGDYLEKPYWASVVLGMQTGTLPRPANLLNVVDNLPAGTMWQCIATGRYQLPLTTMAMVLGGHVRVGLEDNVYYRAGELAESNAQLVRRTARIAAELDRPVASPAETRDMLGL